MSEYKIDFNLRPFLNTNTHTQVKILLLLVNFFCQNQIDEEEREKAVLKI